MTIKIVVLNCLHCGREWIPRYPDRIPRHCPSCHNINWDQPRKKKYHHKRKIITESNNKVSKT